MTQDRPILVVEDDRDTREAIAFALKCAGFSVEEAEHGREALDKLRAGVRPSLIVLDLMMPVMDGRAFRREQLFDLEAAIAAVPVVVLSASPERWKVAQTLGAVDVMSKPLDPARLVDMVRNAIRR